MFLCLPVCVCVCQMLNCTEREDEIREAGQEAVSRGASLEASVLVCWVCKTVSTFRQMRAATVDSFNQTNNLCAMVRGSITAEANSAGDVCVGGTTSISTFHLGV